MLEPQDGVFSTMLNVNTMEYFTKIIQMFDKILNAILKHVECVVERFGKFRMFKITCWPL